MPLADGPRLGVQHQYGKGNTRGLRGSYYQRLRATIAQIPALLWGSRTSAPIKGWDVIRADT